MSKDELKSKRITLIVAILTGMTVIIAAGQMLLQYQSNKNQFGGSMNVMWQNHPLNNNETKTIVICLENGAISLDSLIVTPTFVNVEDHELTGFSLRFETKCENITLAPTALFKLENPHGINKSFKYDKESLPAHDKTPSTPFSSIKLNNSNDSKGKCSIKSIATYNGIQSVFECSFEVWFFVVPNKNNLSNDQWRTTCERFVLDQMKDVSCEVYCFANEKVTVRNESEPNVNNIDNTNYNKVDNNNNNAGNTNDYNIGSNNNNQKVYYDFSHAFNADSTSIVFTSKSNGISFVMKLVEGGTFLMGAQFEDPSKPNFSSFDERLKSECDFFNETPVHEASLNSFYLGETEVTQELWRYVTGNEPTYGDRNYGRGNDYPVYYVSWERCQSFIKRLNSMTGLSFRLPTEEEWEFAARGGKKGNGNNKYAGGNDMDDLGWYCRNSGEAYLKGDYFDMGDLRELRRNNKNKTHPVKTKCPNELGLYDMSGNVWEMCSNKYYSYSYGMIQTNNTGNEYVQRGGSWGSVEDFCRVSCRGTENKARNATGFRLALPK